MAHSVQQSPHRPGTQCTTEFTHKLHTVYNSLQTVMSYSVQQSSHSHGTQCTTVFTQILHTVYKIIQPDTTHSLHIDMTQLVQ